jgi:hypothetical protein
MTISVDWKNYIIRVPKADMMLVQSSPIEVRELNLNNFRLTLKGIEDNEDGINFPTTHNHYPAITVGGVQLARVVEILSPYTVTFEDGQYAVNLTGANSNVADRVNVNQVSVRASNSAGLIQTREIEYASFQNGVTIDVVDGTDSTMFPYGTPQSPCKTLANALEIASLRGFDKIYVINNLEISDAVGEFDHMKIIGNGTQKTHVTTYNSLLRNVSFESCLLSGDFVSGSYIYTKDVTISDLQNIQVNATDCFLTGTIELSGVSNFSDCGDGLPGLGTPEIKVNTCDTLGFWEYSGGLKLTNIVTPGTSITMNLSTGRLIVDSSDTEGEIILRGVGTLQGTTGGTTINTAGLVSGVDIENILSIQKNRWRIVGNQMIIYQNDNETPMLTFNLYDQNGDPSMTQVLERVPV